MRPISAFLLGVCVWALLPPRHAGRQLRTSCPSNCGFNFSERFLVDQFACHCNMQVNTPLKFQNKSDQFVVAELFIDHEGVDHHFNFSNLLSEQGVHVTSFGVE